MIPKIIHYCWFGKKEIPEEYKQYIETWKKYCPDYQIKEWNEENFDLSSSDYAKEAYEQKKWAFVSDYARLKVIYDEGGIYLDTDVELLRSLNGLLKEKCFLASEKTGYIATGLGFGAEKKNEVIRLLLEEYSKRHFTGENGVYDHTACPKRNTKPLQKYGYKFNSNEIIKIKEAIVFPPSYFDPMDYMSGKIKISENTYAIHHYSASWISDEEKVKNEKIDEIVKSNNLIIGQLKKQWFLYCIQKENGITKSFIKYLISKMKLKLNF